MNVLERYRSVLRRVALVVMGLVGATVFELMPLTAVKATAATSLTPAARVSFTFDDGLGSAYTQAAATLQKHGLTGTDYVITGCVGMTTVPNTCRANTDAPYMTWTQVKALQSTYGWEIGSHTVHHYCLATSAAQDPDDCQASTLTKAQVDSQLSQSKTAFANHGITATDFAPPYGDYNHMVWAEVAKYYASMRGFQDVNNNVWPYNDYLINDYPIQETVTPISTVEAKIDSAIANKTWLVLTFHDILSNPSQNPDDYQYSTSELDQIAAYVQSKQAAGQIQSVNVNQGLVTGSTNLLANSSFDSGIASGWTTDAASSVTKDTATNGSYPSATNAIKFVSTTKAIHLFSPKVAVDPNTTYILKNFLNVQTISSGEVGFFIDEYDANGNWISGQWKAAEKSSFIDELNFTYKPSSAAVSKAALQVYATANTGIRAYLDNAQWFPATTSAPPANLVANGTFDAGIASGWSTDDAADIKADANNNGSPANPVNSVFMQSRATSANGHLFSPQVAVSSSKTYSITSWLNIKQITNTTSGEVGLFVDEYDANGQWISGQYKTGDHSLGATNVGFTYVPSSSSVAKASLQVIVVGGAGIQAYFDNVAWTSN